MGSKSPGLRREEQEDLPLVSPLGLRTQARRHITEAVQKIIMDKSC
jgi:hypothetical protein